MIFLACSIIRIIGASWQALFFFLLKKSSDGRPLPRHSLFHLMSLHELLIKWTRWDKERASINDATPAISKWVVIRLDQTQYYEWSTPLSLSYSQSGAVVDSESQRSEFTQHSLSVCYFPVLLSVGICFRLSHPQLGKF